MTAEEFKAARQELGWTQCAASRLFGVTVRSVRRWEKGQVRVPESVATVLRLTKRNCALHRSIDALLDKLAKSYPSALDTKEAGKVFRALLERN
jgi:transcriptional regulator with XRE-family HTH domain